MIQETLVKLF